MIAKFFKRRLASCLCFVLAATCIVSSLPPGITGNGNQVSAAEVHERNWARGTSYEVESAYWHDYKDPDGTKLTDGVYATDYNNVLMGISPRWSTGYITMDLGTERTLNRVVMSGYEKKSYGITVAPTVTVEYFDEEKGEWNQAATWNNTAFFTGNDSDGQGKGYGFYKDEHPVDFTASKVRFVITGLQTGWLFYDEIELYGPVGEDIPSIPVLEKNLGNNMGLEPGGEGTLSVALQPIDYGKGTITYEWYKDGQKIEGADGDSLTISNASFDDAGNYYVVVTNTIGSLSETVTSNTCKVAVHEISKDSLLYGIPFTTTMTYGDANKGEGNYIEKDPATPAENMLTDGLKAGGDVGSIYAAYYNKNMGSLTYADFTFDMGELKQFEQLNIGTYGGGTSGIHGPSRFQVYIATNSGDNPNWKLIHDVELAEDLGAYEYVYKSNGSKITAQQIKIHVFFSVKQAQNWIALDEIELLETADGREPDGIFSTGGYTPADKDNMASWGKNYTVNKTSEDDPDLTALTDGRTGDELGNNWVTYPASSGNLEVVVDLGGATTFEQVDANFLYDAEGEARWPQWVKAEYSNDGQSWSSVGQVELDSPAAGETSIAHAQIVAAQPVSGRYVKLTAQGSGVIALDEVMALKLKTLIVAPEDPDVVVDPNNLAYGLPYTTAWSSNPSYPDDNYELTNGKRGRLAYGDPEWVGFHMNDGKKLDLTDFYITIDLGSVKSFEQVKVGALRQQQPGISAPTAFKVEYSNNMQNWTTLSDDTVNWEADGVYRYIATADTAVSGRYVRVHVTGVSWLFLDEIEVLQVADTDPDPNENPDYGNELNLLRGNTGYTISQKPTINNLNGLLTDGKYGATYTKYDTNWMGLTTPGHVVMNFDLRAPSSVSKIILSSRKDSANNQTIPQNVKIYVSYNNADWINFASFENEATDGQNFTFTWDAAVDKFSNEYGDDAGYAYIRYIRVEFDVPVGSDAVYLDEVKAMGKLGRCSNAAIPYILAEDGSRNLALGASYNYFPEGGNNSYSDPGMLRLTDGIQGSDSFSDGKWVGFNKNDCIISGDSKRSAKLTRSIIVDLKGLKTIKSITYGNIVSASAGINSPENMKLFASVDGEKWLPLTKSTSVGRTIENGKYIYGWHNEEASEDGATIIDLLPDNDMIIARYVRLEVEVTTWTFIDEITVQGFDELKSGVMYADNGTVDIDGQYLQTGENTGGVQDLLLCYTGWYGIDSATNTPIGDLTLTKLRPLLTYIDRNNKAVDTMFDSVLLLALKSQYGRSYHDGSNPGGIANATDWFWFMDKTFGEGGDVDTLNEAARIASEELNDPNYKVKMVLMYPNPVNKENPKFGSLDGERNLTFTGDTLEEDHDYARDWWINEALSRFEAGNYEYVDFVGFYYLNEAVSDSKEEQRVMKFTDAVHEKGMKAYWIPYWDAKGASSHENYGFDATAYQPNHYFTYYDYNSPYKPESMSYPVKNGNPLMDTFASRIKSWNLGAEFEIEGDAATKAIKYNIFLDYLNAAEQYGYDGPGVYRAWYLDRPFAQFAYSGNAVVRSIYEYSYQMMRGTYTQKDYIDPDDFPTDPDYGGLWRGNGVSGDVTGGGSSGSSSGGGSGGGGSVTPKPDDKPDPEFPPVDDENYTWEETEDGYKLKDADGEYVTGWAKVSGKWYYLNADGIRTTGWQKVDNNWYYLKADGVMATGWLKLGNTWYYLNAGGIMQTGWLYNGGVWYYLYDWGGMANSGWVKVGNTWYYFRGNGAMFTGWLQQGSTWYYLKSSGAMATGWNWVGNKCYYFNSSGKMAQNTTVGGYKLDASGAWVK